MLNAICKVFIILSLFSAHGQDDSKNLRRLHGACYQASNHLLLIQQTLPLFAAAAAPFLAKSSERDYHASITIGTTNDVYSMYARPFSGNGYYFEGTPSEDFYKLCEEDGDACYGKAAALGMPEAAIEKMYDINLPYTGGAIMTSDDSGCTDASAFDEKVRDPSTKWGNTAQMAGTYKYIGKTADTDEYISMLPGDFVAMSYLSSVTYGEHMIDMMNAGEVDLVAFGNHEFQFKDKCPVAQLDEHPEYNNNCVAWSMATGNFLYLGNNVYADEAKTSLLGSDLKVSQEISFVNATVGRNEKVFGTDDDAFYAASGNYWYKMVKKSKVCFAGTTETSAAQAIAGHTNVWFTDMIPSAVKSIREMNDDGCNLVIMLTHQCVGFDVLMWREAVVEQGLKLDAVLAGHDHFPAFLNLHHPTNSEVVTPIWKMGMDGQMLGRLVFDFDAEHPNGKLRYAHALPVLDDQCGHRFVGTEDEDWWNNNVMQTWSHWVQPIKPLANTNMDNLLFQGFYDTADICSDESRVGNMLSDLYMRNMSANIAALSCGNIRYALSQNFTERIPLTELDFYEENPFLDGMVSYDMSLLELFGFVLDSAPVAMNKQSSSSDIRPPRRAVTAGFEVEMDPAAEDHNGVTSMRFTGTSHMAGIVDRTATDCGHPTLKCGETIWTSQDGWKVDPMTIVKITVTDYNARYSPNDAPMLRRSFYLSQMSDLCRRGADAFTLDLNGGEATTFNCPPGQDFFDYLDRERPWTDCGFIDTSTTTTKSPSTSYTANSIAAADQYCSSNSSGSYCMFWQKGDGQQCHGTGLSCAHLLVEARMLAAEAVTPTCWATLKDTVPERSVHVWSEEEVTPKGVPVVDKTTAMASGAASAACALPSAWLVGGEHVEDMDKYGITNPDLQSMKVANLPVRRWSTRQAAPQVMMLFEDESDTTASQEELRGAAINPQTILAMH
ncbi:hypothetical protein FOZ61_002881 [Perkinsus olseni]|uniref:5'-Nucleotidase C-terminal domain-containing protein n=1 Tax=Perkinsus olseni TaxID=32597 RepID=A0A7J6M757_PEROL|nr:hypothetical protein FOZ61_002881 [Perkinsus olseni]KAF4667408.1 hypothetical protein FOL46_002547 [Perkinsus olseni]